MITLFIDFTAAAGTQTSADIYRADTPDGEGVFLENVPLLDEQAVYVDTTAPNFEDVYHRAVGFPDNAELAFGPSFTTIGNVWIRDPLRPWADVEAGTCETPTAPCQEGDPETVWVGFGQLLYSADAVTPALSGSETAAAIYARRKNHAGSFQVLTRTAAAHQAFYELITAGGPLFLQLPQVYDQDDIAIQPGDIPRSYLGPDQRKPYRLWDVPYVTVDVPVGPKQGTADANWCRVAEVFPTFGDLTAVGGTYEDLADGTTTDPPGEEGFGEGGFGEGGFGD